MESNYVALFEELELSDIPRVGGKNAALGELIAHVAGTTVKVPSGFAITADMVLAAPQASAVGGKAS